MNSALTRTALGAGLALALVTGSTGPADAAPSPVSCTGNLSGVRTGHLTVPTGATCTLTDSVVRGDVRVQEEATVNVTSTTVRGALDLRPRTVVALTDARVTGKITDTWGTSLTLHDSVAGAGIHTVSMPSGPGGHGPGDQPLTLRIERGSRVVGSVDAKGTAIDLRESRITGDLTTDWGHGVLMNFTVVRGATAITNSRGGEVRVCGSTLRGPARLSGAKMGTLIGHGCAGNVLRSNVTIEDNYGVMFANNLVYGAAAGTNTALGGPNGVSGHSNRFRAARSGDFTNSELS